MAIEKKWSAIGPYPVTAPGTIDGKLTLTSALGIKVKMKIQLLDPVLPEIPLEIKRVIGPFLIEVGPIGAPITARTNVSAYGTTSSVFIPEQSRNSIPLNEADRSVYEEEPTNAIRSMFVDPYGDYVTVDNPLPVQLSDGSINIETLNAQLAVHIDARDNFPKPGDVHDSTRIGDGTNEMAVNSDGSINIVITDGPIPHVVKSYFSLVSSVASGVSTQVASYTVPAAKTAQFQRIDMSGENIATYTLSINSVVIDMRRTYFGGGLDSSIVFLESLENGLPLNTGDVVALAVIHNRPDVGDFSARIQVLEIG